MSRTQRIKPTVILVAGAWHNTAHTAPSVQSLEHAGYRVVPCHPFARPRSSSDEDMLLIKSAIDTELQNQRQVCLVLHSMAARAGCEAVNQVLADAQTPKDRIIHLIWVSAFLTTKSDNKRSLLNGDLSVDTAKGTVAVNNARHLFFNDMNSSAATTLADALEPALNLCAPLELSSEAYKSLPMTYIQCENDNMISTDVQAREAEENGMSVVKMATGHSPFASQPQAFMEVIEKILG